MLSKVNVLFLIPTLAGICSSERHWWLPDQVSKSAATVFFAGHPIMENFTSENVNRLSLKFLKCQVMLITSL